MKKILEDLEYWLTVQDGSDLIGGLAGIGLLIFFITTVQRLFCLPVFTLIGK